MRYKYLFLLTILWSFKIAPATVLKSQPAPAIAPVIAPADAELQAWCNVVTLAIPQIKLKPCIAAQLKPVATKSVKGRQIMLREFKPLQKPAARVLVVD